MSHLKKLSFNGDPNIGMYAVATDSFCLVGKSVSSKDASEIGRILQVPVYRLRIYGTSFLGIFVAATSKKILVPKIIFDEELAEFKKIKEAKVEVIDTNHTALNNNILINDSIAILSKEFSKEEVSEIKEKLGIKNVFKIPSFNNSVPGSCGILTNRGGLLCPGISEKELEKVEKHLKYEIGLGTINMGSFFVGAGVIANSNGFLAGDLSSGIELGRVDESLGFLSK